MDNKRLYKDSQNGVIAGVCAGLAEYLNMDISTVRILVVLIALFSGTTLILPYVLMAVLLPDKKDIVIQDDPVFKKQDNNQDDDLYTYNEDEYKL